MQQGKYTKTYVKLQVYVGFYRNSIEIFSFASGYEKWLLQVMAVVYGLKSMG